MENTHAIIGSNSFCVEITVTTVKKTHNKAQKGIDSVKALPTGPSEVIPHRAVAKMITDRPITPTDAKWKPKATTNQITQQN